MAYRSRPKSVKRTTATVKLMVFVVGVSRKQGLPWKYCTLAQKRHIYTHKVASDNGIKHPTAAFKEDRVLHDSRSLLRWAKEGLAYSPAWQYMPL